MVLTIYPFCNAAFTSIAKCILHGNGEISSEMVLKGDERLCFEFKNGGYKKGTRMHAATIDYCNFSMHTHPLVAYCSALCNMGHPSGDDMQAWFNEAHENGWPAIHLCCAIEGTYIVRVRNLDAACHSITAKLSQIVFTRWAKLHNSRSTTYTTEPLNQKRSRPQCWTDDANRVTYGELFSMAAKEMGMVLSKEERILVQEIIYQTVFEVHFVPNVITFQDKKYMGEDLPKNNTRGERDASAMKEVFYNVYISSLVETTCEKVKYCKKQGSCPTDITDIQPSEQVYPLRFDNTNIPLSSRYTQKLRRNHEHDTYSRLFDLVAAHYNAYHDTQPHQTRSSHQAILSFNKAYERLGAEYWLFWSERYVPMEIASTDYALADGKKRKRVSSDVVHVIDRGKGKNNQNAKVSQYLEFVKKSIQDAIAKLDTSSGLSKEDVQKMKHYYLNTNFTVNELPDHASFLNKNGRMITKPTNLLGLNRPEGVNFGKILSMEQKKLCRWDGLNIDRNCDFECRSRNLFFRIGSNSFGSEIKSMQDLVAHEVAHVDDVLWARNNHDRRFEQRKAVLDKLVKL